MNCVLLILIIFASLISAENVEILDMFFGKSEVVNLTLQNQEELYIEIKIYHNGNANKAGVVKLVSPVLSVPKEALKNYDSLEMFDGSMNSIERLERSIFNLAPNMRVLNLAHNQIESLPARVFAGCPNIFSIMLNNNKIDHLHPKSFWKLPSLFSLRLSYNKIKVIPSKAFAATPKLVTLDLYSNEIEQLSDDSFAGLRKLVVLLLDYNRIKTLPDKVFDPFQKDYHLHLTFNQIESFSPDLFKDMDNNKTLRLEGNVCVNKNFDSNSLIVFNHEEFNSAILQCHSNFISNSRSDYVMPQVLPNKKENEH